MLRALKVSAAVSAGFMSIFVVIGAITKLSTNWLVEKAQWPSLVIGIGLGILVFSMGHHAKYQCYLQNIFVSIPSTRLFVTLGSLII